MPEQIAPRLLAAWLADQTRSAPVLLDVREAWELERCVIPGSVSIPMGSIPQRLAELDRACDIVCICHHGMRSQRVAVFLASQGFASVFNLSGGVHAWAQEVDSTMPVY